MIIGNIFIAIATVGILVGGLTVLETVAAPITYTLSFSASDGGSPVLDNKSAAAIYEGLQHTGAGVKGLNSFWDSCDSFHQSANKTDSCAANADYDFTSNLQISGSWDLLGLNLESNKEGENFNASTLNKAGDPLSGDFSLFFDQDDVIPQGDFERGLRLAFTFDWAAFSNFPNIDLQWQSDLDLGDVSIPSGIGISTETFLSVTGTVQDNSSGNPVVTSIELFRETFKGSGSGTASIPTTLSALQGLGLIGDSGRYRLEVEHRLLFAPIATPIPISLELSPTSIDFGGITMGASSAPQLVTITNVTEDIPGPITLLIGSIALTGGDTGDFVLQNDFCSGQNLGIGGGCTFEVVFSPTITGVKRATLSIPSNDLDMPVVGMPLSGEGLGSMPVKYLLTFARSRPATLTFELHTDSACTSAVHTETISINDPNLLIEPVRVKLGGKVVRKSFNLNFVLTDVAPQDVFFLQVIGTGINAVRDACQQQPLFFTVR